ncbi:hypothetical protein ALC60_06131 [Trachymyrmex zeteki]|uniref:Uncharacterized protein n=1 Tax=Mycetomoellerius zeteki TaxID=64791 RepID=A0A151X3N3_9HYME|nr:hypothetical protein ALC60_06131 [Trachymyrmex zeteki]
MAKNAVGESASAWQVVAVGSDDISIERRAAACGSDSSNFVSKGASGRLKDNDTRHNDQDVDDNQMQMYGEKSCYFVEVYIQIYALRVCAEYDLKSNASGKEKEEANIRVEHNCEISCTADKSRDNSCPRVLIPAVAQVAFDLNLKNDLDLVTYFSDQDGTTMEEFVNIRTRRTRSLNECGILCERNKNTPGTPSCLK